MFGKRSFKEKQDDLVKEHVKGDFATLNPKNADPDYVWDNWVTPLTEYAAPITSFENYLTEKIRASKEKIRVLDIGIGGGSQWKDFVKENDFEFWGTALSETFEPSLKGKVKICRASELHSFFKENYFDVIVSSFGMHDEELVGIENAVYLLKPGREAFFKMETALRSFEARDHYDLLAEEALFENGKQFGVAIRIKKH
ncbi:class I SAM-dependent methyltransferase [Candidatus Micrarchaeota archaeon]|nr:class I SAM-dependent methyltransferase [Candidatus Micrarchaeota archaeon]